MVEATKKCIKCGEKKSLDTFSPDKRTPDGRACYCKPCKNIQLKAWRLSNIEAERAHSLKWYHENTEKVKEYSKRYRFKNKEKIKEKHKFYASKNKEKILEAKRRWRKNNPGKYSEQKRLWEKKNPDKIKAMNFRAGTKKRGTPKGKINRSISGAILKAIGSNKQGRRWEFLVGYTVFDLKKHLEKQFTEGMCWDNYGIHGWHIDHKIPISVFNFEKPEDDDFQRCWSLENLQPLWATDNIAKHNKVDKPIQPSLIFK